LEKEEDYVSAQSILNKRKLYPIAKHYIVPLAHKLGDYLITKKVTPMQVTFLSFFMLIFAGFLAISPIRWTYFIAGFCIWLYWLLDHTDGYIARKTHKSSKTGAYFDSVLGSVGLHFVFSSIALSNFMKTNDPFYLIIGMAYLFGSFMFVQSNDFDKYPDVDKKTKERKNSDKVLRGGETVSIFKKVIAFFDDTDIRFHLLVLLCFFGCPVYMLVFYALYSNFRWVLNLTYRYIKFR
jgi:phosphatidylglycerophosphate synthase